MKVILYQPQIPQNTGNVVRTCAVTGTDLILVQPLGFSVSDRWLKRAGLDYWEGVNMELLEEADFELFLENYPGAFYFFSSKAQVFYTDVQYQSNALLIFGSETTGLPESFFDKWPEKFVKIPMIPNVRCLNLATSVGIGVYEAWRQQDFQKKGNTLQ